MYFEFFIGMGWDPNYLLEQIEPLIQKIETIYGGKNTMPYTIIQAQKAELLVTASLSEAGLC